MSNRTPQNQPIACYRTGFTAALLIALLVIAMGNSAFAVDSESSRKTLANLKGVYVIIEDLQPNLQKYAKKQELSKEQLQKHVEVHLKEAGIRVLNREEWAQAPGRPILYVNVNTHEYQKYQFAYDARVELQQMASLETSPGAKALAATWSINMTGTVNMGTVNVIYDSVKSLTSAFVKAYASANHK
jgi:hypothetical protein